MVPRSWVGATCSKLPAKCGTAEASSHTACPPAPPALTPTAVNFFDLKIIQPLGEGSFGRVYLARYYDTLVAAKICIPCGEHESEEQVAAKVLTLTSLLASLM